MRKLVLVSVLCGLLFGCVGGRRPVVIVYTALDQTFSEPILAAFEAETGIDVRAVYDTEATKTVGLVNRIVAEHGTPRCDVFWNNEIVRTVMLKRRGMLQAYRSPSAADIPAGMKDADGYWTGFAARARVLICNTEQLRPAQRPAKILDLADARWRGRVALAYPLFGTTATHAAALFVALGDAQARRFFERLKANEVVVVDGNAASKDAVVRGEVPVGFTDTDDANVAREQGKPVSVVVPDQHEGGMGALVIPNTVALIAGAPHPEQGKQLIDFLLRRGTERLLAHSGSAQMPVRRGVPTPDGMIRLDEVKPMAVDWDAVERRLPDVARTMAELFVR